MSKFYGLHIHSTHSIGDSPMTIEAYVDEAKKRGLKACALTEHGTLSSAYELWAKCNKEKLTPILGIEAYYVDDVTKLEATVAYSYSHIILLAKNERGWINLKKLQAKAWEIGFLGKPRMDFNMIAKYHEGLICMSACVNGLVGHVMLDEKYFKLFDDEDKKGIIRERIVSFKSIFKKDFYLEIMLNELSEQAKVNKRVLKLAEKYKIEVVVTNDTHYIDKDDALLHDVVKCVAFKKGINDENNGTYSTRTLYFVDDRDLEDFRNKYHRYIKSEQLQSYIANASKVVDKIENYPIIPKVSSLPKYSEHPEKDMDEILDAGKVKLFGKGWMPEYEKRLEVEKETIYKLKMADYMLIVWDIAQEARRRGIPFNTRGSVAGSLVAYLMGISWIDPIRFNCSFERFLTEDRLTLPDIDMDFGKARRGELIDYLKVKYGEECVANIVNFSVIKPKMAIKDVSKVYGLPFGEVNKITKMIPDNTEKWEDIPEVEDLKRFLDDNEEIMESAQGLLGSIRHRGVHASGVVLTPANILKWIPLARTGTKDERIKITEFDMYALDDLNLLKLDFLGQNTLDVIEYTIKLIGGKFKNFDDLMAFMIKNVDDKKVFENIRAGKLIGTFQMGTSEGMRKLIDDMKIKCIGDIIIAIGLYRPAILEINAHTRYIERRHGRENIKYIHPKMGKVLSSTQGILLWQEQSMALAVHLAGFTPTDSDHFRKGIKQKDIAKFKPWQDKFIKGCWEHSKIDEKTAKEIWDDIEKWSSYGFNVAHATSYGLISYTTMWLKTYYPNEFMTALLSYNTDDDDKLNVYLKEVRSMKLKLVNPSVNNSGRNFTLVKDTILYPLTVIKNVGDKAITSILKHREGKKGKYKSFEDFYKRVEKRVVNTKVVSNLIYAGCFRRFGSVNEVYDMFVKYRGKTVGASVLYCSDCQYKYPISATKKQVDAGEVLCPVCGKNNVITNYELIRDKKFDMQYIKSKIFGFVTDSVLKPYLGDFIRCGAINMVDAVNYDGENVMIGAYVADIRKHIDKKGGEMAFIRLTDGEGTYDLLIFSSLWVNYNELVKKGGVYVFKVRVDQGKFLLNGVKGAVSRVVLRRTE